MKGGWGVARARQEHRDEHQGLSPRERKKRVDRRPSKVILPNRKKGVEPLKREGRRSEEKARLDSCSPLYLWRNRREGADLDAPK